MLHILDFCLNDDFQETLVYNVGKDFVFPLLLALVSGFLAWYFFFRQIAIDRQIETEAKETELKNKLTYFALIVHNSIENIKGQNGFMKQMIADFDNGISNTVIWKKYPTYDLKILTEKIDIENYLLSYLKFYGSDDKITNLNNFKTITDSCGVINEIFDTSTADLIKKFEFDIKIKREFSEVMEICAGLFGESMHKHHAEKNPLFRDLFAINQRLERIQTAQIEEVISLQFEIFVLPTLKLLDSWHHKQIELDEHTGKLWINVKIASDIYENLRYETLKMQNMFIENHNAILQLMEGVENASQKLRKDFI